jgi:hypothetical protein
MDNDDIRFSHFIASLALNPARLAQYQKDPEAAMEAAGLDDEEKGVLRTGNFQIICDFLGESVPRPVTHVQGGPGSGPGTGEPGG